MTMKLYGNDLSPYVARCRMAFLAKGLNTDLFEAPGGSVKSDAYSKMNPMQKMPTLEVDGWYLPESAVILEYIEDTNPKPALRPDDPKQRAQMRLVGRVAELYVITSFGPLFGQMRAPQRDQAVVDKALAETDKALNWLEAVIGDKGYAVGNKLTLADCTVVPILFFVTTMLPNFGGEPFKGRPKLKSYWDRIAKTPEAEQTLAQMKEGLAKFRGR